MNDTIPDTVPAPTWLTGMIEDLRRMGEGGAEFALSRSDAAALARRVEGLEAAVRVARTTLAPLADMRTYTHDQHAVAVHLADIAHVALQQMDAALSPAQEATP